jgi:subtilisin family serine protease
MPALGIIGARGHNGIGIAGLNWQVSLMLLRIGAQGSPRGEPDLARADRAARAIRFAADHGARVINWSGYVDTNDQKVLQPLRDAVAYAATREVLLVTGAGNDGRDLDVDDNCRFPQCFDLPNQVRVAEAGFDGQLVKYETGGQMRGSNYGRRRVEIAAIGQNFSTTVAQGRSGYGTAGGTSNAGPVVAGVAALMLSLRPTMTAAELRSLLMRAAVTRPELRERIASGGIVNARRAVELTNRRIMSGQGRPRRPDSNVTSRQADHGRACCRSVSSRVMRGSDKSDGVPPPKYTAPTSRPVNSGVRAYMSSSRPIAFR